MIELRNDQLVFSFPEVHADARLTLGFQRTLRIPDNDKEYPLPPGLGNFPLRHVDDFAGNLTPDWSKRGGVMLPMYQSEAMWLNFDDRIVADRGARYPFAIKVAAGKINAVTGDTWTDGIRRHPQDYMVVPRQPWLDGYCVAEGVIRQFVAMPLGAGYSAEEQVTGDAEHGGVQIAVCPMRREVFERRFPRVERDARFADGLYQMVAASALDSPEAAPPGATMGLAPGGRMRQEIYDDPFDLDDWDQHQMRRCFVHLANSMVWRAITGENPPTTPLTAKEYTRAGFPWFDYYAEGAKVRSGSKILGMLKSVAQRGKEKGEVPLPENVDVTPENVIQLRQGLSKHQVREGSF